ncbi:2-oxoglutarate dehydrogenase E1 component [Coxiella endosymbiont of Amblyomma nuttalli]|uniref:2-oxoglutarate dehydrogenase E1 component n=1 Tax=Coxiella endosymbiont of Amblyomma nuttalli TaxID=2749996 RepID=UPI001BA93CFF|nr:2-oxoglutarate dehydrogenase E1 component [Coxiella endosymbiont of Amblyomma nuttalli]QTS83694.1 2-oxoglutarate dehydrogenase E1 component [Coxiella endosymbiont of Amblyomma nuttalli]
MQKLTPMEQFQQTSYLVDNNVDYIETLYENFLEDPNNVDKEWRHYFQSLLNSGISTDDIAYAVIQDPYLQLTQRTTLPLITPSAKQQAGVSLLIEAYRRFGHLNAKINPLGNDRPIDSRLKLSHHGLSESDFDKIFSTDGLMDKPQATLKEIYMCLREIYCGSIGMQYSTILDEHECHWLQDYVEHRLPLLGFDKEIKRNILQQLIAAETLEKYLDTKYVAQVRYSLEGSDSLIPLLYELIKRAKHKGLEEIIICMAHRGRINVLLNIMGQSVVELFQGVEGKHDHDLTSGDVKYHRGYSRDIKTNEGPIHVSLAFNPSHLEFIGPVVMGSVRARQERQNRQNHDYAMAVMIHGDASFSGEGIVMETLGMSQTRAYNVGGTIHIILNNQIGFTTSNPNDARSSMYCSDVAKMLDSPIFHVNGDDPEAVIVVIQLALDYRMTFHKDVFIDLVCYRRRGHQEVDDPVPTQPLMYKSIREHPTTRVLYANLLINQKICTDTEVDQWIANYRDRLDQESQLPEILSEGLSAHYATNWATFLGQTCDTVIDTSVSLEKLKTIGKKFFTLPKTINPHRKIAELYHMRLEMVKGETPIDWGFAEMMAYSALLEEGYLVRLVGQDSRRGTFFHRHATVFDQHTGKEYVPLKYLNNKQTRFYNYDSLLCENGALGFEYGYSTSAPNALIIWEAQFGDFANVAQVIIDQFISSGYQKWKRLSGLVMFLPHGYEGKGPEHSSARLERYLQLCAQNNIQVCTPTTPAQIFHLLRRQVLRPCRKPLIVMTPKSLLRNKLAVSSLDDLAHGQLRLLIPGNDKHKAEKIKRIVLCSGKVYYDLLIQHRKYRQNYIALIRIEQLYPFPYDELKAELKKYLNAKQIIWCQEEPKNQGAWFYTYHRLMKCIREDQMLEYVGRPASAAPSVGCTAMFLKLQKQLINQALALEEEIQNDD